MMTTIYTWGDTAFLESVWTGLGHIFEGGVTIPLFGSALLLNLLIGIVRKIGDPKAPLMWNFWVAIILFIVLFSPKTDLSIKQTNHSAARVIAGEFPIGLVVPISFISRVGYGLSEVMRDNITPINTGMGMSTDVFSHGGVEPLRALVYMRNMATIGSFSKSDIGVNTNDPGSKGSNLPIAIGNYFDACIARASTITAIDNSAAGNPYKTMLTRSGNSPFQWDQLLVDQGGWPVDIVLNDVEYNTNCAHAHALIKDTIIERANNSARSLVTRSGIGTTQGDQDVQAKYLAATQMADVLDSRTQGTVAVGYLSANYLTETLIKGACKDTAGLGPAIVQSCASQFDSVQQRRFQEASKSETFREMVIPLVTFIEGFVYLLSPIMIGVLLVLGGAGMKIVSKYMTALIWVMLMPICQVAVDLYLNVYFNRWQNSVLYGDSAGESLWSINGQESAWTELASFVAFAGTAQAMVPALAMFILFAGVHTMQGMAASTSGASSAAGTNHADTAGSWKAGSANVNSQTFSMASNNNGGHEVVSRGISQADSNADKTNLSVGNSSIVSSSRQSAQSRSATLGASAESSTTRAIDSSFSAGVSYDSKAAKLLGVSRGESIAYAVADKIGETFGLDKVATGELAKTLIANGSAGLSAKAGAQVGGGGKSEDGGSAKPGASAGLGVDGKVGLSGSMANKEAIREALGEKYDAAKVESAVKSATTEVLNTYSESQSKDNSADNREQFRGAWGEAIRTNAAFNEAQQDSKTLQDIEAGKVQASADVGGAISSVSKSVIGTKNLLNEGNLHAAQSSLLKEFTGVDVGEYSKGWDQKLSSQQLSEINNNLSDEEIASLNKFGMDIQRNENGELDFKAKSNAEAIKQISGTSLATDEIDDFLSGKESPLNQVSRSADRANLIRDTMVGVNDLYKDVDRSHMVDGLRAEAAYFKSVGNSYLGVSGENATGKYGSIISYGAQLDRMAGSDATEDARGIKDVKANDDLDKVSKAGSDALDKSSEDNIKHLSKTTGGTGDVIDNKKDSITSQYSDLANKNNETLDRASSDYQKTKDNWVSIDKSGLSEKIDNQMGYLKDKAQAGLNSQRDDIHKDAKFLGIDDFLDSAHSHVDMLGVSNPNNVNIAKDAYSKMQDYKAVANSLTDYAGENTRLADERGDKEAFTQSLVAGGMTNQQASEATERYYQAKGEAMQATQALHGNVDARNGYDLIVQNPSLMDEKPTDFREGMELQTRANFSERFNEKLPEMKDISFTKRDYSDYKSNFDATKDVVSEVKNSGLTDKLSRSELNKVNSLGVDKNVSVGEVESIFKNQGASSSEAKKLANNLYESKANLDGYLGSLNNRFGDSATLAMTISGNKGDGHYGSAYEAYSEFKNTIDSVTIAPAYQRTSFGGSGYAPPPTK